LSVAGKGGGSVRFLVARRGAGTEEFATMCENEQALLTGPLGNCWSGFIPKTGGKPVALLSGGVGIAPLAAFCSELTRRGGPDFELLSGFRRGEDGAALFSALGIRADGAVIAGEDRIGVENMPANVRQGLVTDFLDAEKYAAVFVCGPIPMMKAATALCRKAGVPCFVSLETRMACGTGACLGCTVRTRSGNRRCCADGPIFDADEVFFDD
jgi:NAD(P)H-flavin reductase